MFKKIFIPILTLSLCLLLLNFWTLGFSSFTVFSYTLKKAGVIPRPFPPIQLIDQDSNIFQIKDKKKYKLVNFVYLNCPFVCHKVNNQLEQIYHKLDNETVPSRLEFITVSFDQENDDLQRIIRYRKYFGDNISGWSFALPYHYDQKSFDVFLSKLGIWKYKIPSTGLINHSIYIFLIDTDNNIIKVFDPARDTNETIISEIKACIKV